MARRGHRPSQAPAGRPRFWGRHAVTAALANPERVGAQDVGDARGAGANVDIPPVIPITYADVADLARLVPADAPHQGLVAEVDPLEDIWLGDLLEQGEGDRRPLRRARSGDRSAQCRRDPALGRGVRRARHRHAGPPCAARIGHDRARRRRARWSSCRGCAWSTWRARSRRSPRPGSGGSAWPATRSETLARRWATQRIALVLGAEGEGMRHNTAAHCDELAQAADLAADGKPQRLERRGDRAVRGGGAVALSSDRRAGRADTHVRRPARERRTACDLYLPPGRCDPAQSSAAIVTFSPSSASVNGIWHDSRESRVAVGGRIRAGRSRPRSSSAAWPQMPGRHGHGTSRSCSSRRTAPASRRSRASRITSITDRPASP